MRGATADMPNQAVDLFGRAASIGALADLGLPRLPTGDAQLQVMQAHLLCSFFSNTPRLNPFPIKIEE